MTPTFKLLKELLSRLTKKEIKLLKKKITYNPIQAEFKNNKSKKLVELILNKPDLSEVQALKYIYSSANRIALIKLVERTILKIDEIYISFDYDPRLFSSERNFQYFILKRKLLILQMRLLRGVESDLPVHLEKIAVSSKKYELYDILIEVLLMKQRFTVIQ
ncbi:MAG: hypothetical protein ABI763_10230, partial [Bacteroidota bacterium]